VRRVRATIVAVAKQKLFYIVSVCVQHAMRLQNICGLTISTFLPHYVINGTISEKKLLNTKCVF
jgi:hypothetical protein